MSEPSRRPLVLPAPKISTGCDPVSGCGNRKIRNLRETVLAPYYKDVSSINESKSVGQELSVDLIASTTPNPSHALLDERISAENRGIKRKAEQEQPIQRSSPEHELQPSSRSKSIDYIVRRIKRQLSEQLSGPVSHDIIQESGNAVLAVLREKPNLALDLAHQKLHTWPYHEVPLCWRRLYEDASLYKVLWMLVDGQESAGRGGLRLEDVVEIDSFWGRLVRTLDLGLNLSGAPLRASLFEGIFRDLAEIMPVNIDKDTDEFEIQPFKMLETFYAIPRHIGAIDFIDFQEHLDVHTTPLIIPDAITGWPAVERWKRPSYLLRHTLNGHRLVPIEIGKSYTDEDWSQRMVSMREFMNRYLLTPNPLEIAYLAQHDLFKQIPALQTDISIPDYCYTTPPAPDADASKTAGLSSTAKLAAPLLNAWLGPAGTKTPLHTDPYHNILAQVVGYKYVRLYSPSESSKIYPRGVDEKGISMENTSFVDIQLVRPILTTVKHTLAGAKGDEQTTGEETMLEFPLLKDARYLEAVLGPGECLYIPLGWWHYVESLSTSFSVSFWWN